MKVDCFAINAGTLSSIIYYYDILIVSKIVSILRESKQFKNHFYTSYIPFIRR